MQAELDQAKMESMNRPAAAAPVMMAPTDEKDKSALTAAISSFQAQLSNKVDSASFKKLQELVNTKARNDELSRVEASLNQLRGASATKKYVSDELKHLKNLEPQVVQLFERVATLEQAIEKKADAAEFKSLQQKATQMVRDIAKLAAALGGLSVDSCRDANGLIKPDDLTGDSGGVGMEMVTELMNQMKELESKFAHLEGKHKAAAQDGLDTANSIEDLRTRIEKDKRMTKKALEALHATLTALRAGLKKKLDKDEVTRMLSHVDGGEMLEVEPEPEPEPEPLPEPSDSKGLVVGVDEELINNMQEQLLTLQKQMGEVMVDLLNKATKPEIHEEVERVRLAVFSSLGENVDGNKAGCIVARIDRLEAEAARVAEVAATNTAAWKAKSISEAAEETTEMSVAEDVRTEPWRVELKMLSQSVLTQLEQYKQQIKWLTAPGGASGSNMEVSGTLDAWTLRQLLTRVNALSAQIATNGSLIASNNTVIVKCSQDCHTSDVRAAELMRRLTKLENEMLNKETKNWFDNAAPEHSATAQIMNRKEAAPGGGAAVSKELTNEVKKLREDLEVLKQGLEAEGDVQPLQIITEGGDTADVQTTIKAMIRKMEHHGKVLNAHQQDHMCVKVLTLLTLLRQFTMFTPLTAHCPLPAR